MAGTLTVGTISDGTISMSSTNAIKGAAKAWVNFDGTLTSPITPRSSFNISSVQKSSTGVYIISFSTPMVDTNYSVSLSVQRNATDSNFQISILNSATASTLSTSSVTVVTRVATNAALEDARTVCVQVFGN